MESQSRIPILSTVSFDGALLWFAEMQQAELLFNPDDQPEEIVTIKEGERVFTDAECTELTRILDALDDALGHDTVMEAAYPIFMNAMGIKLDS